MRVEQISHAFVTEIPQSLDEGVLYISLEYGTVAHLLSQDVIFEG